MPPMLILGLLGVAAAMMGKGDVNTNVTQQVTQNQQNSVNVSPNIVVASPDTSQYTNPSSSGTLTPTNTETSSQPIAEDRTMTVPVSAIPSSSGGVASSTSGWTSLLSALGIPASSYGAATTPAVTSGSTTSTGTTTNNYSLYILAALALVAVYFIMKKHGRG